MAVAGVANREDEIIGFHVGDALPSSSERDQLQRQTVSAPSFWWIIRI